MIQESNSISRNFEDGYTIGRSEAEFEFSERVKQIVKQAYNDGFKAGYNKCKRKVKLV